MKAEIRRNSSRVNIVLVSENKSDTEILWEVGKSNIRVCGGRSHGDSLEIDLAWDEPNSTEE